MCGVVKERERRSRLRPGQAIPASVVAGGGGTLRDDGKVIWEKSVYSKPGEESYSLIHMQPVTTDFGF